MGKSGELEQWNARAFHTPAPPQAGMRYEFPAKNIRRQERKRMLYFCIKITPGQGGCVWAFLRR
jgi:hypothetical protein